MINIKGKTILGEYNNAFPRKTPRGRLFFKFHHVFWPFFQHDDVKSADEP